MDRLRAIADAHYRASPPHVKALAYEFFKALDTNQDGKVSLSEFLMFMTQEGHTRLNDPLFFKDLDRNGDGSLDFWEVLTLYYILKSGRPLCHCCGILIPGTFFSCVECFDNPRTGSYSLCIYCYRSNKSSHNHSGHQQFLDTYTLLETKRKSALGNGGIANINEPGINWQPTEQLIPPAQAAVVPQAKIHFLALVKSLPAPWVVLALTALAKARPPLVGGVGTGGTKPASLSR